MTLASQTSSDSDLRGPYTFSFQMDRRMVKKTWNRWFLKTLQPWRIGVVASLLIMTLYLDLRDGAMSSFSVVNLTLLASFLLLFAGAYAIGLVFAYRRLRKIEKGEVTCTLEAEGLLVESSLSLISLKWQEIKEIRCAEELILIQSGSAPYLSLPANQIPEEAWRYFLQKSRSAGARVVNVEAKTSAFS